MEESSKLALPDAFLDFLKVNGLDPSIYTASDSTPRYIRYSQHFFYLLTLNNIDYLYIIWLLNFVFMLSKIMSFFFFWKGWNLVVKLILKRLKLRWNARLRRWIGYLDSIHFHLIFRLLARRRTKKERWGQKKFKAIAVIL